MKILYITSDFLYDTGGISQHIENLTSRISKNGIEVVIIYINKKSKQNVSIDNYGRKTYFVLNSGGRIKRFINFPLDEIKYIVNKESPSLIHVHTLFEALKLPKFSDIPMVFTNHSSSYLYFYNNALFRKLIFPKALSKFNLIICPSTELCVKTTHKRTLMIPNGVNCERFNLHKRAKLNRAEFLNKIGISFNNQIILLSTRRLVDKNGVYEFIKSNVQILRALRDKLLYLVIGSGPQFNKIQQFINKNSLKNVFLLGKIDNQKIDNFYYSSDFCIIPSKMEAISISALESMASGSIVIANKTGGLIELVKDGVTGFFLDKDLNIEKILIKYSDTTHLNTIRKNAFDFVSKHYSWNRIAELTINAYHELINNK